ncbi:hypothetical protein AWB71_05303 [Caballeronia peredens]|nr:hypothetical protein AWB71_05303 [Caballeronia peredens]
MSRDIIQSIRYIRLTDGKNEVYLQGTRWQDESDNRVIFDKAFDNEQDARLYLVQDAAQIVRDTVHLKGMRDIHPSIQVETFLRRAESNLAKAPVFTVENINYDAAKDSYQIDWGLAKSDVVVHVGHSCALDNETSRFSSYDSTTSKPVSKNTFDINYNQACYDYLKLPVRDADSTIAISRISSLLGCLLTKGSPITEEQLFELQNSSKNIFRPEHLYQSTPVRFSNKSKVFAWLADSDTRDLDYQLLSKGLRDDVETMHRYIERFPNCFFLLRDTDRLKKLQDDEDLAYKGCVPWFQNFEHVSPRLKGDRSFVLRVVNGENNAQIMRWCSEELRNDEDFAYAVFSVSKPHTREGEYLGQELRKKIGEHDAWLWLKARHDYITLNSTLSHKEEPVRTRKLKI